MFLKLIIIILICTNSVILIAQNNFFVFKSTPLSSDIELIEYKDKTRYLIMYTDTATKYYYSLHSCFDNIPIQVDTIQLIEELLKFEGDTRWWSNHAHNYYDEYNKKCFVECYSSPVSIQVHALFLITQLYFSNDPFHYAQYPMLYNKSKIEKRERSFFYNLYFIKELARKECLSFIDYPNYNGTKGRIVRRAYKKYREWFKKVKEIGLSEARKQKFYPLDNCDIAWVDESDTFGF